MDYVRTLATSSYLYNKGLVIQFLVYLHDLGYASLLLPD